MKKSRFSPKTTVMETRFVAHLIWFALLVGCWGGVYGGWVAEALAADEKASSQEPLPDSFKTMKKQRPLAITPEREAAVMAFVEQHHPELRELLISLRESYPKQYQMAVRELFRTSERLTQFQERDAERYEHELRAWKLQSRVQLLVARYKMSPSSELRGQIELVLNEELDEQASWLKKEQNRTQERLKKIDEQRVQLENGRAITIQKKLAALDSKMVPKSPSKAAKQSKKN